MTVVFLVRLKEKLRVRSLSLLSPFVLIAFTLWEPLNLTRCLFLTPSLPELMLLLWNVLKKLAKFPPEFQFMLALQNVTSFFKRWRMVDV